MDRILEITSYPSVALRVQVEYHTLSLRTGVAAFRQSPFPGHTFFQVAITCFLCCKKSEDCLDSIKECTSRALNALCPQLVYDVERTGWSVKILSGLALS